MYEYVSLVAISSSLSHCWQYPFYCNFSIVAMYKCTSLWWQYQYVHFSVGNVHLPASLLAMSYLPASLLSMSTCLLLCWQCLLSCLCCKCPLACLSVGNIHSHEELLEIQKIVAITVKYPEDMAGNLGRIAYEKNKQYKNK